jgi:hypothetical protein
MEKREQERFKVNQINSNFFFKKKMSMIMLYGNYAYMSNNLYVLYVRICSMVYIVLYVQLCSMIYIVLYVQYVQ